MGIEMLGWLGDLCFIVAYFLVSTGKLDGKGSTFNVMNLLGAILYGTYAIKKHTMPVLILETFWGSIALHALYTVYRNSKKKPSSYNGRTC